MTAASRLDGFQPAVVWLLFPHQLGFSGFELVIEHETSHLRLGTRPTGGPEQPLDLPVGGLLIREITGKVEMTNRGFGDRGQRHWMYTLA